MRKTIIALAVAAATVVIAFAAHESMAGPKSWTPTISRIYFTSPYDPNGTLPNTLMVIEGKGFTRNARVTIDGEVVASSFHSATSLHVFFDACSAPETHSVRVAEHDGWGRRVQSPGYKAQFCMQE